MSFLDLKVISSNGKLMASLYSKPADCHQYLHCNSSHTEHTKGLIFSKNLRAKRASSKESDFKEHSSKLKSWLLKRFFPKKSIDTELKKVLGDNSRKVNNKTEKGLHFVSHFTLSLRFFNR